MTPEIADSLGMKKPGGALVAEVLRQHDAGRGADAPVLGQDACGFVTTLLAAAGGPALFPLPQVDDLDQAVNG